MTLNLIRMKKPTNRTDMDIESPESDKLSELNSRQKVQQKVLKKMIEEINRKSKK